MTERGAVDRFDEITMWVSGDVWIWDVHINIYISNYEILTRLLTRNYEIFSSKNDIINF